MKSSSSKAAGTALAVLFLLLFVGALGARIWVSGRSADIAGPTHLAVGKDRVYVHVDRQLYVLSASGDSLDRVGMDRLGLGDDAPIDLRLLDDGRLLVAGQRPARLRLCEPDRWQCASIGSVAGRLRAQLKVAVDEPRNRLVIAGFDSTALWLQPLNTDVDAGDPKALDARGILNRPNDIAVDRDGRIWVADSGNHRVVALEEGEERVREAVSLTARHPLARPGRDWPMMLAPASDGNWWVTQPDAFGKRAADLLVYHPTDGVQARIALPDDADPTDVASLGDAMLVTDTARFEIHRVDVRSHASESFGDERFRDAMRQAAARKARYQGIMVHALTAMVAFGALMIAAAVYATPKGKRFTPPPADPLAVTDVHPTVLHQTHWLKREPKADRLLRWLEPLTYALTLLALLPLAALMGSSFFLDGGTAGHGLAESPEEAAELKRMVIFFLIVVGGLPLVMRIGARNLKARLGTDGQRLWVKSDDGRQISFSPKQLVYSGRQIAARDRLFAVQFGNGRPLYAKGEVETFIAPLLRRARKLSALAMFRHLLANREPGTMALLLYFATSAGAMVATGAWRYLLD